MKSTKQLKEHGKTLMVAHRGVSELEPENTVSAFIAAANRSYFGIETDVHKTKDGKFILTHDDNAKRVSGVDTVIEETDFDTLRALSLFDMDKKSHRCDLHMPSLSEYITICKNYGKVAVLELKNEFTEDEVYAICDEINALGYLDGTIFISFAINNLHYVRKKYPNQAVQYLLYRELPDNIPQLLEKYRFDLDIYYKHATKELIDACHAVGAKVNVWTVNEIEDAETLIKNGIDFITTNIVE